MKSITTLYDLIKKISLILGCLFLISPLFIYYLIHGNQERYVRIINGSPPFDKFGGGPFQLYMYLGLLIISIIFFIIYYIMNKLKS